MQYTCTYQLEKAAAAAAAAVGVGVAVVAAGHLLQTVEQ